MSIVKDFRRLSIVWKKRLNFFKFNYQTKRKHGLYDLKSE